MPAQVSQINSDNHQIQRVVISSFIGQTRLWVQLRRLIRGKMILKRETFDIKAFSSKIRSCFPDLYGPYGLQTAQVETSWDYVNLD